jgi:RND family efflux transporter MFP subunit
MLASSSAFTKHPRKIAMKKPRGWAVALILFCLVGAGMIAITARAALDEDDAKPTAPAPKPQEKLEPGEVRLSPQEIEHLGLKTQQVQASTYAPDLRLFGMIQEDPDASFTLRASLPGAIVAAKDVRWPDIGAVLADDSVIGSLEPRAIPADQIALASEQATLAAQVAAAQADLKTAEVSLAGAKRIYDRLKNLNATDKGVSDRTVDEALVKVQTEEVHLQGAQNTLKVTTDALATAKSTLTPMPLLIPRGGEVVEVTVHPGEAVENGQPIMRVTRAGQVIAAVLVDPSVPMPASVKEAKINAFDSDAAPLAAAFVGLAPARDPKSKQSIVLFRLNAQGTALRPGTPIIASIPTVGEPLKGVEIPHAAIVRYLGKAWVYVAEKSDLFERREVSLDHPTPNGWFITQGVKPGEKVVTTGPQDLLSNEINAAFGTVGGD